MSPDEAKEQYRATWSAYCLCTGPKQKRELEMLMDDLQPQICEGPGPEWDAFTKTLPGFLEFWGRWSSEMMDQFG